MATFPEILEHLQVDLYIHEDELVLFYSLNDRINELYSCVIGLSDLTTPLIGNSLFGAMGMKIFDLMALLSFLYAIAIFIFNCGPHFITEDAEFQEKLKRMRHSDVHQGTINLEDIKIKERKWPNVAQTMSGIIPSRR